ncbi:MAG: hypothetical protein Q8P23_04390, partial [bacterium]|nr:hypothetical protein [bacterium]
MAARNAPPHELPFYTPRKWQRLILQFMIKTVQAYTNKNPILTGLFTMLLTVVIGMSVAFASGLVTPTQA